MDCLMNFSNSVDLCVQWNFLQSFYSPSKIPLCRVYFCNTTRQIQFYKTNSEETQCHLRVDYQRFRKLPLGLVCILSILPLTELFFQAKGFLLCLNLIMCYLNVLKKEMHH